MAQQNPSSHVTVLPDNNNHAHHVHLLPPPTGASQTCLVHNRPMTRFNSNGTISGHHHHASATNQSTHQNLHQKQYDVQRKRFYRVGLNLFNKPPPDRGIQFLVQNGFIDYPEPSYNGGDSSTNSSMSSSDTFVRVEHEQELLASAVAHFLLTRKGLSKKMIGEYIGNLQNPFNQLVLHHMAKEIDLSDMPVDVALRKFQTTFRFPGEAQKIDRIVNIFAQRYVECNSHLLQVRAVDESGSPRPLSIDQVHVLAFAIMMLTTDLHNPSTGTSLPRMTRESFIKNTSKALSELDGDMGCLLDEEYLADIFERIKQNELKTDPDHVTQVMKVQQTLVSGNTRQTSQLPTLPQPHRRLVCYCRLYQVYDIAKKERQGQHQREIFLFNDLLLVTKIYKKNTQSAQPSVLYSYRGSYPLSGLSVILFEAPHYPFGIRLQRRIDDQEVITFNARNEHDRSRFVEDLIESIEEMNLTERVNTGLRKSKSESGLAESSRAAAGPLKGSTRSADNGVVTKAGSVELLPQTNNYSKSSSLTSEEHIPNE